MWNLNEIFIQKEFLLWVVFIKRVFLKEFFPNVTTVWVYKIGVLNSEQLLPDQLVKCLKEDIITVQCAYIKNDLMLLFREE